MILYMDSFMLFFLLHLKLFSFFIMILDMDEIMILGLNQKIYGNKEAK